MATVNPYLNFEGNCEEAFNFYKSVLGGEFQSLMRYKDAPAPNQSKDESEKIIHVSLPIGEGTILMGSDRPQYMGPANHGDDFHISVNGKGEVEATKVFNGLSAGGKVAVPLDKSFWGAWFGMLQDKFGVRWLINYSIE